MTLERELGGGGMSRVFLATDNRLKRQVVVKVFAQEATAGLSADRFEREIQVVASLQQANIVPLLSAGEIRTTDGSGANLPFYTMPYVEGESLRVRVARSGALPVPDAVSILRDVARALAYAHSHGVVHRDIKPDNVLLSHGAAVVTDFGIAKALSVSLNADSSTLTQAGLSIGTPAYMSPEQAAGDPEIDQRTDIYSFGCLAYELLTGASPFAGRPPARILAAHMTEVPPSVAQGRPDIPPPLADLVSRCLEKQREKRPSSADDLVRELDAVLSSGSLETPAVAYRRRRLPRWARFTAAAVVTAVVLATAAILLMPRSLRATAWTLMTRSSAVLHRGRVVVAPFENRTNDRSLDPLGDMAADWISQGLSRVPGAEVVDARSAMLTSRVVENIPSLLRASNNARALGQEVGAATVVTGSFYRDSDSLRFQVQILDVESGRQTRALAPVSGAAATPGEIVARLRALTVGALAPSLDSTMSGLAQGFAPPPSYEAYHEFMQGFLEFMRRGPGFDSLANVHYARAAAQDSTYGIPLVGAAFADVDRADLLDWSAWPIADSMAQRAEKRRVWLSPGDQALLDYVEAAVNGNADAMLQSAQQAVRLFPGSVEVPILAASAASRFGYDSLALAILATTNPKRGLNLVSTLYWTNLTIPLHMLGKYRLLADTLAAGRRQFPEAFGLSERQLLALAALGDVDAVERMLKEDPLLLRLKPSAPWVRAALRAARELRWHQHDAGADRILALVEQSQRSTPLDTAGARADSAAEVLLEFRIASRDWTRAHELAVALAHRDTTDLDAMAVAAATAAYAGDRETASRASSAIEKIVQRDTRAHAFQAPRAAYLQAEIAVAMGDKEQAVTLLSRALAEGRYHPWNVHSDPLAELFLPLRDFPPFIQLMRPKP
jgi:TolB-like protein/tRNA A-37 threonylcarbamoyl transferase component Bud32